MLWTPPIQAYGTGSDFHDAATVSNTPGVSVSLPATANTKGSWAEALASTGGDVVEIALMSVGSSTSGSNSCTLVDVAVGASGSETIIIADLPLGFTNVAGSGLPPMVRLPASIPAGTRIAVRAASQRTSTTIRILLLVNYGQRYGGLAFPASSFTTYGAQSASSNGVEVTPSATANTNGSWVEITSSTTRDHRGFLLLSQGWGGTTGGAITMAVAGLVLELGAGASGSEVVIGSVHVRTSTAEVRQGPYPDWPIWAPLPAGTRLAARCRCSAASNPSIDAIVVGIS